MELITDPWHWAFSGVMIVLVMVLLLIAGKRFGVSSSFRTVCTIAGAGKWAEYFRYDWKSHIWLLLFVAGSMIGGWLAGGPLNSTKTIDISDQTLIELNALGVDPPTAHGHAASLLPQELFDMSSLLSPKGIILFCVGGFLIGFGTRWAGGCTSGHAISGLANLQLPSLIAVIGFFIGGLAATHFLYPYIMSL